MQYNIILDNGMCGTIESSILIDLAIIFYGTLFWIASTNLFTRVMYKTTDCNIYSIELCDNQNTDVVTQQSDNSDNNSDNSDNSDNLDNSDNPDDNDNDNISNYVPQYTELSEYFNTLSDDKKPTQLDDRMKFYEQYTESNIVEFDSYTQFVIRLDGRSFSKLLSTIKNNEFNDIKTPFINDLKLAMDNVTADLVKEFNAATGYNHSDEISLVFRALNDDTDDELIKEHAFNGRVSKLLSLTASYASVRLNKYLRQYNTDKFYMMFDRIMFDSRVIIFPNDTELCNYFVWRSKHDCYRNFVSEIAYRYFPKKSLDKLNTTQRVEKLKKEKNLDVEDFNVFLRHGTFIKRQLQKFTENDKSFWRNVYVRFALPKFVCNEDYIDLIKEKNFEEWEYQNIEFELISEL